MTVNCPIYCETCNNNPNKPYAKAAHQSLLRRLILCKMHKKSTTVKDIFRLALPAGTQLLAGEAHLDRPVSWACSMRPSPPAFPTLNGSELALVDMQDLESLGSRKGLEEVIHSLSKARVAAMVVQGQVDQSAISAAVRSEMPLFRLPAENRLMEVERSIIRLIVDRASYIAQRTAELQSKLNRIAMDGGGLDQLARHLHKFSRQPVILLRSEGDVAAAAGLEQESLKAQQAILLFFFTITALRMWTAQQPPEELLGAIGILPLTAGAAPGRPSQTVISPILGNHAVRGFCLLLQAPGASEISAVEEMTVVQGAAAAALEWAKQHAVDIAEDRMRAAFVDELLAAEIADEQAWIQRGASLNYDLARPHAAWMVEARQIPDWPAPLVRFLEEKGVEAPLSRRDEGTLIFWPVDNPKSAREHKLLANELVRQIEALSGAGRIIIGVGRPASTPGLWMQSQQQARESWRMGKAWQGSPVTYFGDLGLYQLLTALGDNGEAKRFYRKTLGLLINHDEAHNGELVMTLEGYFACHGNLSQTAKLLHIHRNTLSYRLERIAEITRLDLNDPEARFALQLALKLQPTMRG